MEQTWSPLPATGHRRLQVGHKSKPNCNAMTHALHDDALNASVRIQTHWFIPKSFTAADDLRDGVASSPPYTFETTYFNDVLLLIWASIFSTS
jgi:hypothetical protein